jgi:type VI secretion system secreted protein VgrG
LPKAHLEAEKTILDSVPVGKVSHKLKVGGNDQLEIYDYPGAYAGRFDGIDRGGAEQPAELRKVFEDNVRTVAIRMQQEAIPGLVIEGAGNCRQLVSGHKFTLSRHFNADGPYVLTRVEHTVSLDGDFRSGAGQTLTYGNRFTCIPLALPFRPPCVTPKPKVEGTQTAVVVGPPGAPVFCDKYGRVKVQFHWDREGKKDVDSSCWLRVTSPWAGKRRGQISVPLIGDEVVVAFLEGDPDQPVIIGSVYNADMMPPFELPANNEVSGYKGRTGSNFYQYGDKPGQEFLMINAQKTMNVSVKGEKYYTRYPMARMN